MDLLTTGLGGKNGKKNEEIECYGCKETLDFNHLGIRCAQDHHSCMGCSANMVSVFISEPKINFPLKCMICKVALNPSVFERQLTPAQYEIYTTIMLTLLWSKDCLKDDEELVHCGFCSYAEIRVSSMGAHFLFCRRDDCKKISCLICLHEVPMLSEDYDEDEEDTYENNMVEIEKHFKCVELQRPKEIFEQAMENGQKVPCPGCGLSGMKDTECTHMTCPECQTVWCYFCGLKESDCDKSQSNEDLDAEATSIYQHNTDWETNSRRCPMYLTYIHDIDENWPDDDTECLAYFHKIRSLKYLRQAYDQLGLEIFDQLDKQFGIINACGFTLDEIQHANLQLINYDNNDT